MQFIQAPARVQLLGRWREKFGQSFSPAVDFRAAFRKPAINCSGQVTRVHLHAVEAIGVHRFRDTSQLLQTQTTMKGPSNGTGTNQSLVATRVGLTRRQLQVEQTADLRVFALEAEIGLSGGPFHSD